MFCINCSKKDGEDAGVEASGEDADSGADAGADAGAGAGADADFGDTEDIAGCLLLDQDTRTT